MLTQMIRFFKPSRQQQNILQIYQNLVSQARKPVFYSQCDVPDSLDGRYEMILLHMFIVLHCLRKRGGADMQLVERSLSEVLFSDMDRSLREMGVTDTGVGRRVRAMAEAYFGRLKAYEIAFEEQDLHKLKDSIRRNVFGTTRNVSDLSVERIAVYTQACITMLETQDSTTICNGDIAFASMEYLPEPLAEQA